MPARDRGDRHTRRSGIITLTTDIGWAYAAQMKAVLFRHPPPAAVVDLAHDLPRHRIREAAFVLRAMAERFPAGSVHIAVVDPGVGGARAPLVLETAEGSALVGPDNGVLAPLARVLGAPHAFRLDPARWAADERIGTTFDGRDVFAPAAALLARGVHGSRLGFRTSFSDLQLAAPLVGRDGAGGEIVHIDRFGNLITNLPSRSVPDSAARIGVRLGRRAARTVPWTTSYDAIGRGRLGALGSSFGTVELAVGEGRADLRLRAKVGDEVRVRWSGETSLRARQTVNIRGRVRT